ncbi:protein of unknown function [Aminobacter niigataensis]|nr:protein of unknown function [Aminobacter niigataensis]
MGGPLHELLADTQAHLIRAVHDYAASVSLHGRERAADRPRQVAEWPEVAMSAGHRDHGAGWIDARSHDDSAVYRALETEHRTAHVAHRREATHQRMRCLVACGEIGKADVAHCLCRGRRDQHRVPVRIDQAGHQHAAAARYHLRARRLDGGGRDALDEVAVDQHIRRRRQRACLAVEYPDVFEQDGTCRRDERLGRRRDGVVMRQTGATKAGKESGNKEEEAQQVSSYARHLVDPQHRLRMGRRKRPLSIGSCQTTLPTEDSARPSWL